MKLLSVAGARPNFMKISAISQAVKNHNGNSNKVSHFGEIEHIIVHTGQHYDRAMSESFFQELNIPEPDINLGVGAGTHAVQTAEIMKRFELVLNDCQPDILLVVGDVNSTLACALVASKIEYRNNNVRKRPLIVHVEAGLRSCDRDMPEEINRILTDAISDLLFVTERSAVENLTREGVSPDKIVFAGNVMIDTLVDHLEMSKKYSVAKSFGIRDRYAVVTLHRPSNVDNREVFVSILHCLQEIAIKIQLLFVVHPRTAKNLEEYGLLSLIEGDENIMAVGPQSYLNFLSILESASLVITDSGGIQEETTYLSIPCITMRDNTERPITVSNGSNYLTGNSRSLVINTVNEILKGNGKKSTIPELWDGKSADRIINRLLTHLAQ
jgi:UDP-N-acetylglucosamine 2-epimerase (non-hydrolysing)